MRLGQEDADLKEMFMLRSRACQFSRGQAGAWTGNGAWSARSEEVLDTKGENRQNPTTLEVTFCDQETPQGNANKSQTGNYICMQHIEMTKDC